MGSLPELYVEGGRRKGGGCDNIQVPILFSWYVLVSFPGHVVGEKWPGNEASVYVCVCEAT